VLDKISTLLGSKIKINIIDPENCKDPIRKYKRISIEGKKPGPYSWYFIGAIRFLFNS
jgi:hypothetical protein